MNNNLLKLYLTISNGKMRADELYLKTNIKSLRYFRNEIKRLETAGIVKVENRNNTDITDEKVTINNFNICVA